MNRGTVWTVLGVILAVVIAWFVVDLVLSAVWVMIRLALVAVVAVGVWLALRATLARGER